MRPFQAVPAPFTGSLAAPVRAAPAVLSRRRCPCVRATADDKDGFDIDALAKRLSAEASKLGEEYRQSSDSSSGEDEPPSTSASDRGAGQAPQRSAGAPGVFGIEARPPRLSLETIRTSSKVIKLVYRKRFEAAHGTQGWRPQRTRVT